MLRKRIKMLLTATECWSPKFPRCMKKAPSLWIQPVNRIGQINGLAVYEADFYSFGRPTRITATVSLGSGNIINVEREAGMSGRHYNKGVLIISGYFKETFGQDIPLAFNVNLVFEQSYGTVDGDSASCAEIYALLSTLSGLPLKQEIAVTGSLKSKR